MMSRSDDVRALRGDAIQGFLTVARGDDAEPLLGEGHGDELGDLGLVVGDKDQWASVHAAPPRTDRYPALPEGRDRTPVRPIAGSRAARAG